MSSVKSWLENHDAFRALPSEFRAESTRAGAIFTGIMYLVILIVTLAETRAFFFSTKWRSEVRPADVSTNTIQVNIDVHMLELPCKFLKVSVLDFFGERETAMEQASGTTQWQPRATLYYTTVDRTGKYTGSMVSHRDKVKAGASDEEEDNLRPDIDHDWAESSQQLTEATFEEVVGLHHFTLVNFFADWCSHCIAFHPSWKQWADEISMTQSFTGETGDQEHVKFIKVNCVAFKDVCTIQQIRSFPTLRLYKKDLSWVDFDMTRTKENLVTFIRDTVSKTHVMTKEDDNVPGCRISGSLHLPRVAGEIRINANAGKDSLVNAAMTNVSHVVNHLSFGRRLAKHRRAALVDDNADNEFVVNALASPLDNLSFVTDDYHQAPQHFVKAVASYTVGSQEVKDWGTQERPLYRLSHADRVAQFAKDHYNDVPIAKFHYDFPPMAVVHVPEPKAWYEFVTSLLAIVGGAYSFAQLMVIFVNEGSKRVDALFEGKKTI